MNRIGWTFTNPGLTFNPFTPVEVAPVPAPGFILGAGYLPFLLTSVEIRAYGENAGTFYPLSLNTIQVDATDQNLNVTTSNQQTAGTGAGAALTTATAFMRDGSLRLSVPLQSPGGYRIPSLSLGFPGGAAPIVLNVFVEMVFCGFSVAEVQPDSLNFVQSATG